VVPRLDGRAEAAPLRRTAEPPALRRASGGQVFSLVMDRVADVEFLVGVYDAPKGGGVYPLTWRQEPESWFLGAPVKSLRNASYAMRSPRHRVWYVVDEEAGRLGCFSCEQGEWRCLSLSATGGTKPCFVSVDPDGGVVAVANYGDGSVAIFSAAAGDGALHQAPVVHRNEGRGPHHQRQKGPHAHCVRFAYGRIYSTDLGTDEILVHSPHGAGGFYTALRLPPGEGPRHIVFHPNLPVAYVLTELGSSLFTLGVETDGRLSELRRCSTLPAGFTGHSLGGHLALGAHGRLYASNRGDDSIAVFNLDDKGLPELAQIAPAGGKSPRFFLALEAERRFIVAHETTGIAVLELLPDSRIGAAIATIPLPGAAFIGRITSHRD
jgi:6-phosphogluconolactonase